MLSPLYFCTQSPVRLQALTRRREQIADSAWLSPGSVCYFLARGSSLGSCHEARLLWEEGVKSPATAMGTGALRHGPQEWSRKVHVSVCGSTHDACAAPIWRWRG